MSSFDEAIRFPEIGGLEVASSRYAARCVEGRASGATASCKWRQPLGLRRPLEEPPLRPPMTSSVSSPHANEGWEGKERNECS